MVGGVEGEMREGVRDNGGSQGSMTTTQTCSNHPTYLSS